MATRAGRDPERMHQIFGLWNNIVTLPVASRRPERQGNKLEMRSKHREEYWSVSANIPDAQKEDKQYAMLVRPPVISMAVTEMILEQPGMSVGLGMTIEGSLPVDLDDCKERNA